MKGLLYALIGALTPLSTRLAQAAAQQQWPTDIEALAAGVEAFLGAVVAYKAYLSEPPRKP